MCFGSSPRAPAPPALPPAPPAPPTPQDPSVTKAKLRNKQVAALAAGRSSTILTSGLGLTTPANTAKKSLLGT